MKQNRTFTVRQRRNIRSNDFSPSIKSKLLGRSLAEFLPLMPKELELVSNCAGGNVIWKNLPPPNSAKPENTVRADFLRFLLLGGDAQAPVSDRGITVCNAWITGRLDLLTSKNLIGFRFVRCKFEQKINLINTQVVNEAHFHKCVIPEIQADRLHSSRSFIIFDCLISGSVSLIGAKIDGDLHCGKSKISSIVGTDANISGRVRLTGGFESAGVVDFSRAKIGGNADMTGAQLNGNDALAFLAIRAKIDGDLIFGSKFKSVGGIRLRGIFIGGSIRGSEATYEKGNAEAISFDEAKIMGSVYMKRANVDGTVRLLSSRIGLDLSFVGANISEEKGQALHADRTEIGGGAFFTEGFQANGIRISGLKTGASLSFDGAKLSAVGDSPALSAQRVNVSGSFTFQNGFSSTGKIDLSSSVVGLNLSFTDAEIRVKKGRTLVFEGMKVAGAFHFFKMRSPVHSVSLSSARVGRLVDDEISWGRNIALNGFIYSSMGGNSPFKAAARLRWLDKQPASQSGIDVNTNKFAPQPWRQLRKVLMDSGHFTEAREIAIAYERRLRDAGQVGETSPSTNRAVRYVVRFISKKIHFSYGVLIGYGYQPYRLVCWMIAVWFFCGVFYWLGALGNVMAPSNPLVFDHKNYGGCKSTSTSGTDIFSGLYNLLKNGPQVEKNWYLCPALAAEYTGFSPFAYSLDVLLPVVDLQQQNDWAPKIPTPKTRWYDELSAFSLEHLTRFILWFEIIFGWISSLLLIAVLSGLAKRHDE